MEVVRIVRQTTQLSVMRTLVKNYLCDIKLSDYTKYR